jgi:type I site-specific restriction endonuclease
VDKKALSERDICTKYITPAIAKGGWDVQVQVRENVHLTNGRVIVRGRLVSRGTVKFADYVLCAQSNANIPLAIVEAKDNHHGIGDGMQQRLGYADMLEVPLAKEKHTGAKAEQLMRLCDDVEAKLRRAEGRPSKLVGAVVREMMA